jgi:DNA polymerase-3 subunit delta'
MKLSDIIGHDQLKPKLMALVGLKGSYLFHGPPSIGKRTISFELAKYFLCQDTKEDGCSCPSCKIFSLGHPDFLCIGRDNKILVDDIDEILEFISRAPLCSETKVVVIDNADVITYEASNRLLKTIEESAITFFLITSRLRAILPTLRSRCLKVSFDALGQDSVTNILWKRMGFEPVQARVLGWIGSISSMDVFSNAGLYLKYRDMSLDFMNLFSGSDFINVLDFVDKIPRNDLVIFIDMVVLMMTDILLVSYSINSITNSDRRQDIVKMLKYFKSQNLIAALNILSQVKKNTHLNINLGLVFKSALIKTWSVIKS